MAHIRIISPSGAIDPTYIDQAAARLRKWGYTVSEGQYARGREGRFAGTDEQRLSDLKEALHDPTVDIVLCSRGGYGLQRILPSISEASSKLIIGFSDITALHQYMGMQGQPTIHGLMCKHLATLPEDSDPIRYWRQAVEGKSISYMLPEHPLNRYGEVHGYLCGGNLSVLYGLQGTPFGLSRWLDNGQCTVHNDNRASFIDHLPPILFIEDIAERHYHIDRMIRNLKMSGVLAQLGGLIVGQFSDCEDDATMGGTIYETIWEAVREYDYPVIFNFPAGHVEDNLPLRFFSPAHIQGGELRM